MRLSNRNGNTDDAGAYPGEPEESLPIGSDASASENDTRNEDVEDKILFVIQKDFMEEMPEDTERDPSGQHTQALLAYLTALFHDCYPGVEIYLFILQVKDDLKNLNDGYNLVIWIQHWEDVMGMFIGEKEKINRKTLTNKDVKFDILDANKKAEILNKCKFKTPEEIEVIINGEFKMDDEIITKIIETNKIASYFKNLASGNPFTERFYKRNAEAIDEEVDKIISKRISDHIWYWKEGLLQKYFLITFPRLLDIVDEIMVDDPAARRGAFFDICHSGGLLEGAGETLGCPVSGAERGVVFARGGQSFRPTSDANYYTGFTFLYPYEGDEIDRLIGWQKMFGALSKWYTDLEEAKYLQIEVALPDPDEDERNKLERFAELCVEYEVSTPEHMEKWREWAFLPYIEKGKVYRVIYSRPEKKVYYVDKLNQEEIDRILNDQAQNPVINGTEGGGEVGP